MMWSLLVRSVGEGHDCKQAQRVTLLCVSALVSFRAHWGPINEAMSVKLKWGEL